MLDGILSLMCCRLYSPADFGGCYPYAGVFDYSLPKLDLKISDHLQKRPAPSRGHPHTPSSAGGRRFAASIIREGSL